MAVLHALKLQNAGRMAKNGSSARTAALKCVQDGKKWQFCTHGISTYKKSTGHTCASRTFMQLKGLEPSSKYMDMNLNHARMPIPPQLQI